MSTQASRTRWRALASRFRRELRVALVALIALWLTPYLARVHVIVDLFTSFQIQYAVLSAFVALAALPARCWRIAGVAALLCVLFLLRMPLQPGPASASPAGNAQRPFKIVSANLFFQNPNPLALLTWIEQERPDFIALQEYGQRAAPIIDGALAQAYPHKLVYPREDPTGMAVFSRYPFTRVTVPPVPGMVFRFDANLVVRVDLPAEGAHPASQITVFNLHPLPPIEMTGPSIRNLELALFGNLAGEHVGPLVIAGDLNITPWSPYFTAFRKATGLVSAYDGQFMEPTWPVAGILGTARFLPESLQFLVRIPIDYVFFSPDIHVVRQERGPDVGSDHFPHVVELLVP